MVPSSPWPARSLKRMSSAGDGGDSTTAETEEGLLAKNEVSEVSEAVDQAEVIGPASLCLLRRSPVVTLATFAGSTALLLLALAALVRHSSGEDKAAVPAVVQFHRDTGLLHWHGHEHKCLSVEGRKAEPGTHVQVWACHKDHANQHFIFPREHGLIHWATHPEFCLQTAQGKLDDGNFLVLQRCDPDHFSMVWSMPTGTGPIRLLHHPDKCIDEHNLHLQRDGYNARLGTCPIDGTIPSDRLWKRSLFAVTGQIHWKPHGGGSCLHALEPKDGSVVHVRPCNPYSIHTQFIFPGRFGLIRWAAYPHFCLHLPKFDTDNGSPIQLWTCHEDFKSQQFEVPDGTGPVRLRHSPEKCLRAVAEHGIARLHDCSNVLAGEDWTVVPKEEAVGHPSLYCVAVMQPSGYEHDIFRRQLDLAPEHKRDLGIFDCEEFGIFSKQKVKVGWHHRQGWVHSTVFRQAYVGISKDGTAGNAELFMHFWDAIKSQKRYKQHDWTIKIDPDCVVIPSRLRSNLQHKNSHHPMFIENCNAIPGGYDYPMTYGALEVLSRGAVEKYFQKERVCKQTDWHPLGEDVFMVRCLRSLGVEGHYDPSIIGDRLCKPALCGSGKPAYHPFKSADSWMGCWNEAMR